MNELAHSISDEELIRMLDEMQGRITQTASALPTHEQHIASHCAAV